jgi:hypothetical protein
MNWLYEGVEYELPENADHSDLYGFVYLITNIKNGRKYIGKKFFWRKKILPITKSRKRRKHTQVESDWKSYYGSSEELNSDIDKYGKDNFRREILHLCRTKGECGYLEAKEQFVRDALLTDEYYNTWIQVRVRKNHINGLHLTENGV